MKLLPLLLIGVGACAQSMYQGAVAMRDVSVVWESRLEPDTPKLEGRMGNATRTEPGVIKRAVCNFDNATYFGFDLKVETLAPGRYRLHFSPSTISPETIGDTFRNGIRWSLLPLPSGSAVMDVRSGDTVALDLFRNRATGQKLTDYVTVTSTGRDMGAKTTLEIAEPRVSVDGREAFQSRGIVSGWTVWIDMPSHGRFVFSPVARPDIGVHIPVAVSGSTLTWRSEGREYRIIVSKPVVEERHGSELFVHPLPRAVSEFSMGTGLDWRR